MILSIIVIVLVLVIAYIWASRGFFSALVHMVCVLIAGAVALGVWEPIAYLLLDKAGNQEWIVDMVWGASLAVPFALVLAILRLVIDKLLPANADLDGASNLIGGGLCGLISGTITVGILIISVNFLRLPQDFAGFTQIDFDNTGSLKHNDKLIFPVDRITAGVYGYLSDGALRTSTPLAAWRPALADDGALLRTNYNTGGAKHTLPMGPKEVSFELLGRYTVGEQPPAGSKPTDLLKDTLTEKGEAKAQTVTDLDGNRIEVGGAHIEGFLVNFKPGAREKSGGIVIGHGQIQLVCRSSDDSDSIALQPFAMISQQEGDKKDLGRWRFDAPRNFFRSAGGASEATMAFEFLVPRGYTPLAVYVKGVRTDASEMQPFAKYPWIKERDQAIRSGNLLTGVLTNSGELDDSSAVKIAVDPATDTADVIINNSFIGAGVLNKDNLKGLEIDDERRVVNGEAKFFKNELTNRGLERQLQVKQFAATEDTRIVQVRVGNLSRIGMLSGPALACDFSKPPILVDEAGQRYAAVGYMYADQTEYHISFLPGKPVRQCSDLPPLSGSRKDQDLFLIYRVSEGVKIKRFAIGNKTVGIFNPSILVPKPGQ